MYKIDTLSDFFNTTFNVHKKELAVDSGWSYDHFREYLLALSRSREYLHSIDEYPTKINLSETWHELLNKMRVSPIETWALVGYQDGQRRLILPTVAEKGLSHRVPYQTIILWMVRFL